MWMCYGHMHHGPCSYLFRLDIMMSGMMCIRIICCYDCLLLGGYGCDSFVAYDGGELGGLCEEGFQTSDTGFNCDIAWETYVMHTNVHMRRCTIQCVRQLHMHNACIITHACIIFPRPCMPMHTSIHMSMFACTHHSVLPSVHVAYVVSSVMHPVRAWLLR